jgi:hypothetical protein
MIRRSTWMLVALFAVMAGLAWYLQGNPIGGQAEATPTTGMSYLFPTEGSSITSLAISDRQGVSLEVQRDAEGAWTLVGQEGVEADVGRIESAVRHAETLRILSTLETQPDLAIIGLEPPEYRLSITLADGRQQVAFAGSATPTGSGYYAHLDGGELVVVNLFSMDGVLEIFKIPPVVEVPEE